jgi:copper chaperone CopZ
MRLPFIIITICLFTITSLQAQTGVAGDLKTDTVELKVTKMGCEGCADKIRSVLSEKKGVIVNWVNPSQELVWVEYNPSLISVDEIMITIIRTGFSAERKIPAIKSPCRDDCSRHCCTNNVDGKCKCFERGKDCSIGCCGAD